MTMDARAWQSAKQLLAEVVDLPLAEQRAHIERRCSDPAVRAELLAMLESPASVSEVIATAVQLAPGAHLGPYEILGAIGAGGMGEVYRARDPRLGRDVAIKVLPLRAVADPVAEARFTHEARAVAALNHPHICAVYDVGNDAGRSYLVMELLDGETLHQRLKRGRVKLQQLIEYGIALAESLAVAHDRGIIHRDLKPSNIIITTAGELKVLDFGLAKQLPAFQATLSGATPLTAAGSGVGTLAYMSPEQMRGEEVDARSDLFSLGAVLYEMATGRAAFDGPTSAVVAEAVLNRTPASVSEMQADLPPSLAFVIDKALEKDRGLRYQSARALQADLERVRQEIVPRGTTVNRRRVSSTRRAFHQKSGILLAALGLVFGSVLAGYALGWLRFSSPAAFAPYARFDVLKQSDRSLGSFALSPDGRYLAYVDAAGDKAPQIYVRALETTVSRVLPDTEGADFPFWSPDGETIGFFARDALRKVALAGGPSQTICASNRPNGGGGAWNREGVIIFSNVGGLWRVPATGGAPEIVVADPGAGLRWPQFLPDGRRFLYFDLGNKYPRRGLRVGSLDTTDTIEVLETGFMGRYAPPGYLLYVDPQWNLVTRRFDPKTLQLSGGELVVSQSVGINRDTNFRNASFSVSDSGSLVVSPDLDMVRLQWIDRAGTRGAFVGEPDAYTSLELSPDGRRVALEVPEADGQGDLWMLDLARGDRQAITRTKTPFEYCPRWSPNGEWIAYSWTVHGFQAGIRRRRTDGTGTEEILAEETPHLKYVSDWSRDGTILFAVGRGTPDKPESGPPTPGVILADTTATAHAAALPLSPEQHMSEARYSPDGRWIAYVSDETRIEEIYLQRVGGGARMKVSIAGGQFPLWRADGAEMYYVAPTGALFAVPVTWKGDGPDLGIPVELFHLPVFKAGRNSWGGRTPYSTRDGRSFLVFARVREGAYPLTWTMNWPAVLPQK